MTPDALYRAIYGAGMTVRADGDELVLKPADRLTPDLRALLISHKSDLIAFLHQAQRSAADVLEAAMRVCDLHGDGLAARADMARDCRATPLHLQRDLLDHFRRTVGAGSSGLADDRSNKAVPDAT